MPRGFDIIKLMFLFSILVLLLAPQLVLACASLGLYEYLFVLLNLTIVFSLPFFLLVLVGLYLKKSYRDKGFWWIVRSSIKYTFLTTLVFIVALGSYILLDNYNKKLNSVLYDNAGVLKHPLCW